MKAAMSMKTRGDVRWNREGFKMIQFNIIICKSIFYHYINIAGEKYVHAA